MRKLSHPSEYFYDAREISVSKEAHFLRYWQAAKLCYDASHFEMLVRTSVREHNDFEMDDEILDGWILSYLMLELKSSTLKVV